MANAAKPHSPIIPKSAEHSIKQTRQRDKASESSHEKKHANSMYEARPMFASPVSIQRGALLKPAKEEGTK
ncbi:hypothetical protein BC937DRAFT_92386 [Endogone sp. FLAS-F59071]|nr:hypothetical protein BC937DRAFT_92386 [Endogone sp. FLAS-F59071]|eukprot:RUS15484.1 hypothetical protein BC937DRAFT_92386 [Endogone sp. FLAS-F59071]